MSFRYYSGVDYCEKRRSAMRKTTAAGRQIGPTSPIFTVYIVPPPDMAPPCQHTMKPVSDIFITFLSLTTVVVRTTESTGLRCELLPQSGAKVAVLWQFSQCNFAQKRLVRRRL